MTVNTLLIVCFAPRPADVLGWLDALFGWADFSELKGAGHKDT